MVYPRADNRCRLRLQPPPASQHWTEQMMLARTLASEQSCCAAFLLQETLYEAETLCSRRKLPLLAGILHKWRARELTRGLQRDGGLGQRRRLPLLRLRLRLRVHERGLEAVGEQVQRGLRCQEPCTGSTMRFSAL